MRSRIVGFEKRVDESDFRFNRAAMMRGRSDPVDEAFWLLWGDGAVGWFLVGGVDEGDGACGGVFFYRGGGDGEGGFHQTDGFAWCEAEVVWGVRFAEIAAFDVEGLGEGDCVGSHCWILGEW